MLHVDEQRALDFARARARDATLRRYLGAADDAAFRGRVAGTIAREEGLSRDVYEQAADWLGAAVAADANDLGSLVRLAALEHRLGNRDAAVVAQERAIAVAAGMEDVPRDYLARLEEALADYRGRDGGS